VRNLIACVLAAGVLLGCAAAPKPAVPAVTKEVKLDSSNIAEAQAAGYKVVNENGKSLLCRKELLTGSHVRYKTSCLTAQEWEQLAKDNRESVQNMSHRVPPPQPLLK
jgi:hypothetical protein